MSAHSFWSLTVQLSDDLAFQRASILWQTTMRQLTFGVFITERSTGSCCWRCLSKGLKHLVCCPRLFCCQGGQVLARMIWGPVDSVGDEVRPAGTIDTYGHCHEDAVPDLSGVSPVLFGVASSQSYVL